jgi:hypothetical protein
MKYLQKKCSRGLFPVSISIAQYLNILESLKFKPGRGKTTEKERANPYTYSLTLTLPH